MNLFKIVILILICHLAFSQVKRVDITMTRQDFESLYQRRLDSKKDLPVTITIDGVVYKGAGIRFKGKTSLLLPKKPLKIKFEKDVPVPEIFKGIRIMDFNAMYTDKSYMREKLVWEIFNMMEGFGPREFGYVNLFINGVDNGINILIQHVNKDFFRVNRRTKGDCFEAQFDDIPGNLALISDADIKKAYENMSEDESDYSNLKELINTLNNTGDAEFANTVNNLFDIKTVYDWIVLNSVTENGDTYAKNYYLYKDPDRKSQQWSVIPWDFDLSFGREGDSRKEYPNSILNDVFSYENDPFEGTPNLLRDRINKDSYLKEEYKKRLKYVLDNIFTEDKLFPLIDNIKQEIEEYVKKEPVRWGTYTEFEEQAEVLKYFITARRNYLYTIFFKERAPENDEATLDISSTGIPYNFVDHDGKQVASITFKNMSGLQKITVHAFPSAAPPGFSGNNCIKRYIEVIPYPSNANFSAEMKWEFENTSDLTEVGNDIQDTHLLACYNYINGSWQLIDSRMNSYGDYTTIPELNESNCGQGRFFALKMADDINMNCIKQNNLFWQRFNDIEVSPGGNIFITGDDGTMLKSEDRGASWKNHYMGVHQQFRSLAAVNNNLLYACGMYGYLLKSTDAGYGWQFLKSGTDKNINCIVFKDEQNGFAACDENTILTTHNGGSSWNTVHLNSAGNLKSLVITSDYVIIAGDNTGNIFKSDDDGKSWKISSSVSNTSINKLRISGEKEILGACDNGFVIISKDNGNSWTSVQVGTSANLYGITITDKSDIYTCGEYGAIFRSADGKAWTEEKTQFANDFQSIAAPNGSSGIIIIGNEGTILQLH